MRIEPETFVRPAELGRSLAGEILGLIKAAPTGRFVLGCPAGRSLTSTCREFAALLRERSPLDAALVVVMMDEYLASPAPPRRCDPGLPYSCLNYAGREIAGPLRDAFRGGLEVWAPDPAEPDAFEARLEAVGGIDLFLLASGASDGHVAFNPPGSPRGSRTRIIELAAETREDNLLTFPAFGHLDAVPTHGVSVGIDTIVRHSRRAVMVLTGTAKAASAARILGATAYDPAWPATVIQECASPRILLDQAASQASITR